MFLSNPRKSFLLTVSLALIFQACGSSTSNVNAPASLSGDNKSEFPFSTKEPEVYQGDIVISGNNKEDHYFVARKGDRSRIDYFPNTEKWRIEIRADKSYLLTPAAKVYVENAEVGSPSPIDHLGRQYFIGVEQREFEELGKDGNSIKYRVKPTDQSRYEIVLWVDQTNNMIVKEELTERFYSSGGEPYKFVYELQNLKLDVNDSIFEVPTGYRKVLVGSGNTTSKQKSLNQPIFGK